MRSSTVKALSWALFLGLLLWGGLTLLVYIGVPVHGAVLFNDTAQNDVATLCAGGGFLCRGVAGFFPFIIFTIARLAPFLWYIVICVIVFALLVGWQSLVHGEARLRFEWKPWYLLPLFLASVWLLFTVLSNGVTSGMSLRQIPEPSAQVYGNIGEAPLQALKENFDALKGKGCLSPLGQTEDGIALYQMKESCIQASFFSRVVPQLLVVLVLLFEFLVLGRFLLQFLRLPQGSLFEEATLAIMAGVCGWVLLLWLLAVVSLFTMPFGWALIVALPILLWRHSLHWLRAFFLRKTPIDLSWRTAGIFLGWLLISYLALNFLTVVRPFPIGWDDLGSYLNRPHLLVSYGHFISMMSPFQWEYLTAIGFLLFGYANLFGATASMIINWMAGLLAVLSVILFARAFLGKGRGLLAGLLYYTLPLVGHFSFADMKIDNAVFMMGVAAMFCVFVALFPSESSEESAAQDIQGWKAFLPQRWQWLILGGIFAGFAFGFKFTGVMVFLALIAVLLGNGYWIAGASGVLGGFILLMVQGPLNVATVLQRIGLPASPDVGSVTAVVLSVAAVVLFVYAWTRRSRAVSESLKGIVVFGLGFAIAVVPWILHDNVLKGNVIPRMELAAPDTLTPSIRNDYASIKDAEHPHGLPKELAIDPKNAACTEQTGGKEELDRYWGFSGGLQHYLTLPWRVVMNADAAGYYVTTMPALLLFPLLLLLPMFWTKRGKWLRWLVFATAFLIVQWMFVANGVPWYGIGIFLGLVVGLEAFVALAPDVPNKSLAVFLIALSLLISFAMRVWQFEQQRNLFEYPMGKVSAQALRMRTIPYYDQITSIVMQRNASLPDRPYLYRVGTFIPYFIPKNLEVIGLVDHQLDYFHCLNQEKNPELTLKRLKALGFNSIIFDTNTATIEKDLNGSLHKKVQEFVDFLNTPSLHLQVLVNDPGQGVAFVLIP